MQIPEYSPSESVRIVTTSRQGGIPLMDSQRRLLVVHYEQFRIGHTIHLGSEKLFMTRIWFLMITTFLHFIAFFCRYWIVNRTEFDLYLFNTKNELISGQGKERPIRFTLTQRHHANIQRTKVEPPSSSSRKLLPKGYFLIWFQAMVFRSKQTTTGKTTSIFLSSNQRRRRSFQSIHSNRQFQTIKGIH